MSAWLKFTDPDGRPVYIRAAAVEAVNEYVEEPEASFGIHPTSAPEGDRYTRVHTADGFYKVAESVEDVAAELHRSGR